MEGAKIEKTKNNADNLREKMKRWAGLAWTTFWKVGRDDPRRAIHALKVGISLTLVSLLYLVEPLYKGIGQTAIWAVMTVVVVLEFTAGATLCKGFNRGLGTLLAGSLAFFIEYIANQSGHLPRAIFIGSSVFVIGGATTYLRFFPYIKKNYEYGVVIFLLTFNLITVSSFRVTDVLKIAHDRFYTIAIGIALCLMMTLFIFPIWSGEDLHNSTVSKLEGLARSMEGCVNKYFSIDDPDKSRSSEEDPIYKGYKAVLDSKSSDETLALYASWEPRHTIHCYKFPWQQYVKLGGVLRHFGYTIVALHGCLQTEIQTPRCVRALFKDPCIRLSSEVSKALRELADSIRNRRQCPPEILSEHLHQALQDLDAAFRSQPRLFLGTKTNPKNLLSGMAASTAKSYGVSLPTVKTDSSALREWKLSKRVNQEADRKSLRPTLSKIAITSLEFSEALPFAAFASLLVETVARLDLVIEEVEELGRISNYKEFDPDDLQVIVDCEKIKNVDKSSSFSTNLPYNGVD